MLLSCVLFCGGLGWLVFECVVGGADVCVVCVFWAVLCVAVLGVVFCCCGWLWLCLVNCLDLVSVEVLA